MPNLFGRPTTAAIPDIASIQVDIYYKPHRALDKPDSEVITIPQPEELSRMRDDIRDLRSKANIIIIFYHWGISDRDALLDY